MQTELMTIWWDLGIAPLYSTEPLTSTRHPVRKKPMMNAEDETDTNMVIPLRERTNCLW